MRKISFVTYMIVVVASLLGCAGNNEAISKITAGYRQDIFQIAPASQAGSGKALLNIEFPIKTYKTFFFGSYIKYTNPPYNVVVNIDGQVTELTDEPVLEDTAGHYKDNPEAGTGWKYQFRKSLVLVPGRHRISVVVPLANIVVEKEVVLKEGYNLLQLVPIYNMPISRYSRYTWFSKGLRSISIKLNSEVL